MTDYGPFTQDDVTEWVERMKRLHPARVALAVGCLALYPYALATALAVAWIRRRRD